MIRKLLGKTGICQRYYKKRANLGDVGNPLKDNESCAAGRGTAGENS
ncbi:hypothetical protein [Serratia rubidaea]|nr:hypothetical protein [Serratia rubidaea]